LLPSTYHSVAAREDTYWWHRARRELAVALFRRHGLADGCRAIDLGCGTGGNLSLFDAFRPALAVGVDLSEVAIGYARGKSAATLVRADLSRALPFGAGSFDVCTIFNVLYHSWIKDDCATLAEACRILRPGGLLLATEPAFPILARRTDKIGLADRRYRPAAFAAICVRAGFEVLQVSCFTSFGVPMILAVRALEWGYPLADHVPDEAAHSADMRPLNPFLNRILLTLARWEAGAIAGGLKVPIGVTLGCLCRKPG
jgi:SAM-dependent methyltransferase